MAASVQQRPPFGERTGQQLTASSWALAPGVPTRQGARACPRCSVMGFSLHANTQVPAHRRDQLERLIRYTARGAVSPERLDKTPTAISSIPSLIRVGRHHLDSPPRQWNSSKSWPPSYSCSRVHLVRYGGVWHHRTQPPAWGDYPHATPTGPGGTGGQDGVASLSRAWLLKRVFALDMARCPWCQRGRYGSSLPSRTVRSSGRSSSI